MLTINYWIVGIDGNSNDCFLFTFISLFLDLATTWSGCVEGFGHGYSGFGFTGN